jgi:hypothetical protein
MLPADGIYASASTREFTELIAGTNPKVLIDFGRRSGRCLSAIFNRFLAGLRHVRCAPIAHSACVGETHSKTRQIASHGRKIYNCSNG